MGRKSVIFYLILFWCLPFCAFSQVGCEYVLTLFDSFGDGWNGGFLTITVDGKSEEYAFEVDEEEQVYSIEYILGFTEGNVVSIRFTPGFFPFENSFRLTDSNGETIYSSGPDPNPGINFQTTVDCPSCPNLLQNGVSVDQIRHDRALIHWIQNDTEGEYLIKFGPAGTAPEELSAVSVLATDQYLVNGLEEKREYDVYLQAICTKGDTSSEVGPFTFETLWGKDVGIQGLVSPVSECGLAPDVPIQVTLKNFGGLPQTLIPYNFSVNGVPGEVNQPIDGFFTGILSYGGTYTADFDATFDFSEPIAYEIKVWTELDGDNNPENDTLTTVILNTPVIDQFPYGTDFESGNEGWTIDPSSSLSSLEIGQPNGDVINSAASGQRAWVTNLDGNYNNLERSVLLSPCLDFSALSQDPELSFALWVSTESTFDGLWVETSVDGGAWAKLGTVGNTGTFWYNTVDDFYGDWWSGDNLFGGWRKVRYPLSELAGKSDIRIRMVFESDGAVTKEGIGIDDIFIAPTLETNLSALEVVEAADGECGSDSTEVIFTFSNEGVDTQKNFLLTYQINDGPEITEVYPGELTPNSTATYTFKTTFDTSLPGDYAIRAWTEIDEEEYLLNDTVLWLYSTAGPGIPYLENFESGELPADWTLDPDLVVNNSHNSGSYVLFDNLWENDPTLEATTPVLGPIADGDSLYFSYRFVNFKGMGTEPTVLQEGDALSVEVSEDCGLSFNEIYTINASNHQIKNTATVVRLPLDDYTGQWIKVRFRGSWGAGDFYVDLDNVNVRRCPETLGLQASVNPPTDGKENGSIRISGADGLTPYRYLWNNGNNTASRSGLAPGRYEVTVSDQQGCTDQIAITLESVVATDHPVSAIAAIRLAPNPNDGQSLLRVELKKQEDIGVFVFDTRGSLLQQHLYRHVREVSHPVDIAEYPNGVYFIRILAGREVRTVRSIKANKP